MLVVTFAAEGRENCVVVAGREYVYARTAEGSFVLPAQCPHRGGPLNLARLETGRRTRPRLVCPWHENRTPLRALRREGTAAVRRGNVVTAVLPEPDGMPYRLEHRPLSGDLSCAAR